MKGVETVYFDTKTSMKVIVDPEVTPTQLLRLKVLSTSGVVDRET